MKALLIWATLVFLIIAHSMSICDTAACMATVQ